MDREAEGIAADPGRERLAFLRAHGVETRIHSSQEPLITHLMGTRALLIRWGARPTLADAGLFHSVYGTEYFPEASVPPTSRNAVQEVIGAEAEELVWLWCAYRRDSLEIGEDGPVLRIQARDGSGWKGLGARQFDDLVDLWIADTLEQLPRMPQREIPTAMKLRSYVSRAMPGARAALESTCSSIVADSDGDRSNES
jgi:hypothetical protein